MVLNHTLGNFLLRVNLYTVYEMITDSRSLDYHSRAKDAHLYQLTLHPSSNTYTIYTLMLPAILSPSSYRETSIFPHFFSYIPCALSFRTNVIIRKFSDL